MKVYLLQDDFDYKNHIMKYRPIVTSNPQDGFEVASKVRNSRGKSLLSNWEAPEIKPFWEEPEKPVADISFIGVTGPITVNNKAVDGLRELFEASGELLPLDSEEGKYYIHNVTQVVDAINLKNSVYKWIGDEGISMSLPEIFSFHAGAIYGLSAFRASKLERETLYTDIFKQRVEEADLKGVIFQLIWDSEDPNYQDERYTPEQWERIKQVHAKG